jgi:dephospho-CoA kinase
VIPAIGIVGGIGSGKSMVADAMRKLGGFLVAADSLGHEALRSPDIKTKVIEHWGNAVLDESGEVDRKKLGRIVFADAAELKTLEALVFPYIERRIREETADARNRSGVKFIILDAAIMLETGWHRICDKLMFVDTPAELRVSRLAETRGWDAKELERRERAQMPVEEKRRRADAVIVNDADSEKVARQVKVTLEQWKVI